MISFDFTEIEGFEWDKGNQEKNQLKHSVTHIEAEEVFSNQPLIIFQDQSHSTKEKRFGALGKTMTGRQLAIFFTLRHKKVRIISARDQGKKDRLFYQSIEQRYQQKGEIL